MLLSGSACDCATRPGFCPDRAEIEFDANYQKFTEGMFLVKATSTSDAIAALTTDDVNLRNIASAANNPSAWSLPNIFIGVTIGRAILQFSEVFLALLSAFNNTTTDAKVNSVQIAGQSQIENYASTTKMREYAANIYAERATSIANQQAVASNAAAGINRDFATGGVESAYRKQVQGVAQAYRLNLEANQINLSGALKAAEIMRSSGMKAARLDQMSQIVNTLSRDLARRTELAMTLRY